MRKSIIAIIFPALLTACVSVKTDQFSAFSKDTENFSLSSSSTYQRVESAVLLTAIIASPDQPITKDSFKPEIDGKSFDLSKYISKISARIDLVEKYAKAAEELAGQNINSSVDDAAKNLAKSAAGFGQATGATTTETANYIGALADVVGKWATYKDRMTGLNKTLTSGQPALERFSKEIDEDTKKIKALIDLMASNYIDHANAGRPKYGTWQRFEHDKTVAAQLKEYEAIKSAFTAMNSAASKLPEVNNELLQSLHKPDFSLSNLKNFGQEVKQLRKFYSEL